LWQRFSDGIYRGTELEWNCCNSKTMIKPLPHISTIKISSVTAGRVSAAGHPLKWLLAGALVLGTQSGMAAETEVTPDQVVSAIEETFGVTPGQRRNHIKGTCATGEFIGNPKAAHVYSRSALFSGRPVPVVARFSLAGGNPKVPDVAYAGIRRSTTAHFSRHDGRDEA
jgi:hypothetical protein